MKIIVGAVVKRDNKILMIKEAKKEFYGKWSLPAGRLEEREQIVEGALREVWEETGCTVQLESLLPIKYDAKNGVLQICFVSKLIEENEIVEKDEILEKKWMTIEEIKNIEKEKLRYPEVLIERLEDIETEKEYPMELIKSMEI